MFYRLAGVHDHDVIGGFCHHTHIVGDHDGGGAGFALGQPDDVQDLGLDGDVEGRRRLIGNEYARVIRNRNGDDHALAHTAGKLVREGLQAQVGLGDAHQI